MTEWKKQKQLLCSSAWKQLEVEVLISRVKEVCLPRSFPMAGYLWHQTHAELCNATPVCFYEAGQEVNIKQWAWLLIKTISCFELRECLSAAESSCSALEFKSMLWLPSYCTNCFDDWSIKLKNWRNVSSRRFQNLDPDLSDGERWNKAH